MRTLQVRPGRGVAPWLRAAIALGGAAGVAGCLGPPPVPSHEGAIASATGIPHAVAFRTEGEAVDAGGGAGDALGLADAVRLALTHGPALQASLARVRVALAESDQARLLPNPVLSLLLKFPVEGGGGSPIIEAGLTAELLSVLQAPRRASAADHRLRGAAAEAVTGALDLVAEVRERYAEAQAAEELLPVLEGRGEILARLLAVARDRLEAGEGTRSDLTTLEAQRVTLEVEIAGRAAERADARLRLGRLIGEPSGETGWLLEPWRADATDPAGESEWIGLALRARPEVQAARWELAALGDDRALAGWGVFDGTTGGATAERDGPWRVGPSASVPLPVFDTGRARRERADARIVEARHRLTQAQRLVVEDVRRSRVALAAALGNLARVERELIPIEERRRAQAEEAYRAGASDATALFLAEGDLRAAQAKRADLRRDASIASIRLERAVGGGGRARALGRGGAAPDERGGRDERVRPGEGGQGRPGEGTAGPVPTPTTREDAR